MNKKVLDYVNKLEGYKTAIKSLHWDSDNLSQHELCDKIADTIAEFQDKVSEVEQSITGKLDKGELKPEKYKVTSLKKFVEDVLDTANTFYKSIEDEGDTYTGMRSDCESFLSDMQRNLYLVNFTLKEELKNRLRAKINESMPKNLSRHDEVDKFMGRKPKSIQARINQIYRIVKKYGIDSKVYSDEAWQAISDYYRAISSLGCEVEMKPCGDLSHADSIESDGGYCDYAEDGMPRSKQYAIKIAFQDGMAISGYIKCMAAGTVQDPFSRYDTCIVLWPKNNRVLEIKDMEGQIKLTEEELKQIIKEAATKILSEGPEDWALADSAANGDYLDDPYHEPNSWDDDGWEDGNKDMENDYSWNLHDRISNVGMSPVDHQHDVMDAAQTRRDHAAYWTDRDNERGRGLMDKWINGERSLDDLDDADFSYDPYKYNESKEPLKITEAELRTIIKEAATSIIQEYGEHVTNYVKRNGCTRRRKTGNPIKDRELEQQWLERQREKERKKLEKASQGVDESIEIKPENKGKFTATKKATGKSTEELTHSKNPLTRKRANFAKMAKRGWKPLKESDYMDDGDLESQYRKNPDSMWTYGQSTVDPYTVDGLEPNQIRHAGNGNIKNDNNASWDYFDAVSNGADMKMRNRLDAAYKERTNNSSFNNIRKNLDMDAAFPQTPNERFKQDLDKQWKDTQDIDKYSRQANSRPLHRKGSLNRA